MNRLAEFYNKKIRLPKIKGQIEFYQGLESLYGSAENLTEAINHLKGIESRLEGQNDN